jgi:xanthine dehydrogenase/oxidase
MNDDTSARSTTTWHAQPVFFVNGKKVTLRDVEPDTTMLQYLRSTSLTGTKLGCGEGGCGACTVMVSRWDSTLKQIVYVQQRARPDVAWWLMLRDGTDIKQ